MVGLTIHSHLLACLLVPSVRGTLATVVASFLQSSLLRAASLSCGRLIDVLLCISSIQRVLGRPLLLLPSPHASIISFSNPSALITCPKYINFCLMALCCSVKSPLSCPISWMTDAFVFFSVHDIPCNLLHIHISHVSILSSVAFVFVHVSHPYNTIGKIVDFTSPAFVYILTSLSLHIFPIPCIADFPSIIYTVLN